MLAGSLRIDRQDDPRRAGEGSAVSHEDLALMAFLRFNPKVLLLIALTVAFVVSVGAEENSGGKSMGLFGKKEAGSERPAESFSILQNEIDGRPLIAMINMAYKTFKSKSTYPWFLSVSIPLINPTEDGLTASEDAETLNQFEDAVNSLLRKISSYQFVGRVTWNAHRELLYYVDKPKEATGALQAAINSTQYRPFAFQCEQDKTWHAVEVYLKGR